MDLPEITEVQRLSLKPGDQLVLRVGRHLTDEEFDCLKERVKTWELHLGKPVIVLDDGMSLEVVEVVPC